MSRLRQSPKHLFEAFLIFEVEASGTGFAEPNLVFQYPDGGRRCSISAPEVDVKAVGQFCLPYAPQEAASGADLPWAMLKEQAFTFSLTDEHSFLQFAVCLQAEITGIQRRPSRAFERKVPANPSESSLLGAANTSPDSADGDAPTPPVLSPPKKIIVCVVSHYPWRDFFSDVVRDAMSMSVERRIDFLRKLAQKDSEFRFHQLSGKKVRVVLDKKSDGGSGDFKYEVPNDGELPASQSPDTEMMCQTLGSNLMVKAFCAMLMERRIIVMSKDLGTVTRCIYTLNALMYPLSWQHTFIPMMPYHVKEVVCAMMPYVIGIHSSLRDEVIELVEEDDDGYVLVDCDKQTVESPFHDEKRINRAWLRVLSTAAGTKRTGIPREASKTIALGFSTLFVETCGHIDKHVRENDGEIELDHDGFLKGVGEKMQPFLIDLMETQGFLQFVQTRCDRRLQGKDDAARSDLFSHLVSRQAAARDAASHAPEPRTRTSTFSRLFNSKDKGGKKRMPRLSGLGIDRFRPSTSRKAAVALQKARASTSTPNADQRDDGRTYAEYMQAEIADMEVTMRTLEKELAAQTAKHSTVAMQYAALSTRSEVAIRMVSAYNPAAVSKDGIKTHGALQDVEDTLSEIHDLRQSLVSITQQQVKINGSALSGVANLKAFWAVSQLDPTNDEIQTEELTSEKVVQQLAWLLDEARHVGDSHDLALDRIAICVADTKRALTKIERSCAEEGLEDDGVHDGSAHRDGAATMASERRYSESESEALFHILVCTGECRSVWPELSAVLVGSSGTTEELALSKSLKGGRLRMASNEDIDEGADTAVTAATEDIFEVKAQYIGQLSTIELRVIIPDDTDATFEWQLQMLQVSGGGGATWTFPCKETFSVAAGLCHTLTAFGVGDRRATSTRRKTRGASMRSGTLSGKDAARAAVEHHKSLMRAASLRLGQVDVVDPASPVSTEWKADVPSSRDMRRMIQWDSLDESHAETDALLDDLHRSTGELELARSPSQPKPWQAGRESLLSDDSVLLELTAEDVEQPVRIRESAPSVLFGADERLEVHLERDTASVSFGCNIGSGVDGLTYAFEIQSDSPAAVCGLKDRDHLVMIDGVSTEGKPHAEILKLFSGKTSIRIDLSRAPPDDSFLQETHDLIPEYQAED